MNLQYTNHDPRQTSLWSSFKVFTAFCGIILILLFGVSAFAQTAGEAAITGTVTDADHAAIPNATVTAHNVDTGVDTVRTTSSAGLYQISPLIVGNYTVSVSAPGFQELKQQGIVLSQNQVFGFNPVLTIGNQSETVTVTDIPPALDTVSAQLGANIEAHEFMELPVLMSGQQRDITSFSNLLPGAQAGSRSSLFSGTANRVQEVYLNGIPLSTISQIGDNRPIFNVIPSDAIGEVGALSSGQSVEYQGAGSVNYNMKSGGNTVHGSVSDYVRNTVFDTWGFTAPAATQQILVNGVVTKVPAPKPVEHQNELSVSVGGPIVIPHVVDGHNKLFFYGSYTRAHSRNGVNPAAATVPTTLMRKGDFSELIAAGGPGYKIYDPTSQAACTANSTTGPCRYAFGQVAGTGKGANGNPSGTITNIIPDSMISPIAKKMQSFLPDPINSQITSNYLGGTPTGYDNQLFSGRVDYTVSSKQTIAGTFARGSRVAWPYTSSSNMILPAPYIPTTYSTVIGYWASLSDSYTFTPSLVNQFKYGYSYFGGPPIRNVTQGNALWSSTTMGIGFTGLPTDGQALNEFPSTSFGGTNAPTGWGAGSSGATSKTVTHSYTAVDNLLWIKGKHAFTFGVQVQWLEDNADAADGPTGQLTLNYATSETSGITETLKSGAYVPSYDTTSGYSYASYMLGAVGSSGLTYQPFSVLGGRYHTFAPYAQDTFKITPSLTLTAGLRWDYLPTFNEAQDRWSFLNPNITNPLTGNKGALQFAGNWGGSAVSIGSRSPVNNYMKNWGPRLGLAYSLNNKTVVRAAYSLTYSHAGGTGGAGGAYNGTGQLGFNISPSWTSGAAGPAAGPAFYLNNSTGFAAAGLSNVNYGGAGYAFALPTPGASSQLLNVGNTVDANGNFISPSGAPGYADPYLSGRSPEFSFWNFGVQRELTSNTTLTVNYAGSESHFIAGASNMRGLQAGQIDPKYLQLGSSLSLAATSTNLAAVNTTAASLGLPAITSPYAGFTAAAATTAGAGKATVMRALTWMPQFSGSTDTWPVVANANYNSLQVSIARRTSRGLTYNLNYTFSKNIDNAGTQRSGYAIPGSALLTGQSYAVNRIDRSISGNSVPTSLSFYGTYKFPALGQKFGGDIKPVKWAVNDWSMAWVATYVSGTPLFVISTNCSAQGAGQCMPDINPNYTSKSIRQNGNWGDGALANNLGKYSYLTGYINSSTPGSGAQTTSGTTTTQVLCAASTNAYCNAGVANNAYYMIGDAPRWSFGLRNPSTPNLNLSVRRTFPIYTDRMKFQFAADCTNVANHPTFGGINVTASNAAFGQVTSVGGKRDFQFSGKITF